VSARSAEAAQRALAAARTLDPMINAFSAILDERAALDAGRCAAGSSLEGLTVSVKNLFDVQGEVTLAGSIINRDHPPAIRDAPLISRLNAAGAVLAGLNHMGEYAYDFTGENSHYGASRNPHDLERMSGGSSGGSAAAVAAGVVDLALGSDTNGSIRLPSALCGVFGLRPTAGRLTRTGVFPFCETLDQVGPFALDLKHLARAFDVLQASEPAPTPISAVDALGQGGKGLRVGRLRGYFDDLLDAEVLAATDAASRAADAQDVVVEDMAAARAAAFLITNAESGSLHLANLRTRLADFDPATRPRFVAGALTPADWYVRAQAFRRGFTRRMERLFGSFDVLLAPAAPTTAPRIGQKTMILAGREMAVRPNLGLLTQPVSLAGLPVLAAPLARPNGLPIGLQLIGPPGGEGACFRLAAVLAAKGVVGATTARLA
jgi:aspartyl-tRNA(Asn)/glutamyl-tRNA(Gln) amidotransferase subunit A